jgi:hypothetical protein
MKKKILFFGIFLLIFAGLILALSGSGTSADPYLIHNWTELNSVRNDLSENYKLVANLSTSDSDYSTYNSGNGWLPIGNDTNPFTGTFDGNGKTISGLYENRLFNYYQGLFGYINSNSIIQNISLEMVNISGYYSIGGLVGYNDGGTIKNSYSTGYVKSVWTDSGGLVGVNLGTITNSYSTVNISGYYYVGGLVGYNDGNITNSYSIGNVSGTSNLGGLVGYVGTYSVINNSYYNNLTSNQNDNDGRGIPKTTTQMQTQSTFSGWDFTNTWQSGTEIVRDYNNNTDYPALFFQSNIDLIPPLYLGNSVNNTQANKSTLFSISVKDNYPLNPNGYYVFSTNNSGSWVNDSAINFTSFYQSINVTKTLTSSVTSVGYKWYIYDNAGNSNTFSSSLETFSGTGSGTSADPYMIYTWKDLSDMRNHLSSYYKLANNLNLSTSDYSTYNSGNGWIPIGNDTSPFSGELDGNYYNISDIYINRTTTEYNGLFGYLQHSVIVKNLGLNNLSINANNFTGGLVGYCDGCSLYNIHAQGNISGYDTIGGIVGEIGYISGKGTLIRLNANITISGHDYIGGILGDSLGYGDVINSYSIGNISGHDYIGGLIGWSSGLDLNNSYSFVNVSGTNDVGGILGYTGGGAINYVYSTGYVSGVYTQGGLIGLNGSFPTHTDIVDSFWDINTSGQTTSNGGTGKNTTQMQTQSTYTNWDFTNIWAIDPTINEGYPYLREMNITLISPSNDSVSSVNPTFNCSATNPFDLSSETINIWDSSGTLINTTTTLLSGNYNYSSITPDLGDGTYHWGCTFNDTYGYIKSSENNTVYVSTIAPAINLNFPQRNQYLDYNNSINFNFTASDSDGLGQCELWGNFTGSWNNNYTFTSPSNGFINSHTLNLSDNKYIWNVFCNDTYGNGIYAPNNFTVTIDTINPVVNINSISTTNNSQTFTFNSTVVEANLGSCKYSIYNSTGGIDGLNNNVSISCNSNPHSATVTGYANFTLRVYANDLASHESYNDLNFTTSQVNGTTIILGGGGGGGGTTERIEAQNYSVTSTNYLKNLDISLAKDSVRARTKNFYITNKGSLPITLTLACEESTTNSSTRNISICNYVDFNATTITIAPNENDPYLGTVSILTPENSSNGDIYYFNILGLNEQESNVELYSKLSVSAGVRPSASFYKWVDVGKSGKSIPLWFPLSIVALVLFVLSLVLSKKYKFTGFLIGILLLILTFIVGFAIF